MANTIKNDMSNNQEVMDSIVGKTIEEFSDDKIKRVGKNAFRGCGSLSSIELPTVRSIADRAFKDCESLEDITVGLNYDGVTALGDDVFDGCENVNVLVPSEKVDLYKNSDAWRDFVKREDGVIVDGPGSKGSIYGMKDSITVNWGKCGGDEDVVVTYHSGEGIWIPKAFLTQAFETKDNIPYVKANNDKDEVGYIGTMGISESISGDQTSIFRLPDEIGSWLYNEAENASNGAYGRSSLNYYKTIAMYPNSPSWNLSNTLSLSWVIGIRKKEDILKYRTNASHSGWAIPPLVRDDAYYLVASAITSRSGALSKPNYGNNLYGWIYKYFTSVGDDTGTDHLWLRYYNMMTADPSATNMGEKYTLNSFLKTYSLPLTVNWGKCGGTEDVIVNYDKDEGLWIPKEFLSSGFDSTGYPLGEYGGTNLGKDPNWDGHSVGHVGAVNTVNGKTYGDGLSIYKLPHSLGGYLYNSAESSPNKAYYGLSDRVNRRAYKGIAIYPDHAGDDSNKSATGWGNSDGWGIGIRKKSDIKVQGYSTDGDGTVSISTAYKFETIMEYLDDDSYYLVAQVNLVPTGEGDSSNFLYNQLVWFGTNRIYFRHWKDMTAKPSVYLNVNLGKPYDVPLSLLPYSVKPLGGEVFYIDPNDNGVKYTFYDENYNKVKATTLEEINSKAKYYAKTGASTSDKFYVYYPTKYDSLKWGYSGTSVGATGSTIGTGKTNTNTVMSRTDIATGTIWSKLSEIRTSSGIDDWFIPSKDEIDKFRVADLEAWHRSSGGSYLWSSSESSAYYAWYWNCYSQSWNYSEYLSAASVFFVRAF